MFALKVRTPRSTTREDAPIFARSAARRDVGHVLSEPGQPLDRSTLGQFQTAFSHDFTSVRIHTDERSAASAATLSARAYTVGRHIVFGRGEYEPATAAGRRLLGHELAHAVQQSRGAGGAQHPGSPGLEAAADHAADQALRGAPVAVAGRGAVGIACKTLFEEFSGGDYNANFLRLALENDRPIDEIVADVNSLGSADRDQAIKDATRERAVRKSKHDDLIAKKVAQKDPTLQAVFDPMLKEADRVLARIDAVLDGLALRKTPPGWNFTPGDFAKLTRQKRELTMAPDSGWFPAKLQDNLAKTLAFVLGPQISPAATEGVNAMDFFHGHLVIKKAPATDDQAKAATKRSETFNKDFEKERTKAIGNMSLGRGYSLNDKKIGAYKKAVDKVEPAFASVLTSAMQIPGAAVMYHTFEFNQPSELKAKHQKLDAENPRRHYVTPLDTNSPRQYSPPASPLGYEAEFTHIAKFAFLIDPAGAIHVRPFDSSRALSTLELSTITGTTYPEPLEFEN